ncbi:1464_t:CDS:2 [Ambispora leptoticha]|uniref:1464_t:CDS:1 n=1 Tax=Ambispora leptoticha TaxID=144679 RepID=A0A9N9AEU5_9GLOM|nr:1464_t:CDS:2 [Ambispora leptoticha]
MVFCLVLGEVPTKMKHFVVDITKNISTISHLQSAIKKLFRNYSRALRIKPIERVMEISDLRHEYPQDSFYIADSVIPAPWKTRFTFLVTTPKSGRWHEFNIKYKNKISENRVKALITRWGCIPRRIFDEYDDEPNVDDVVSQCDAYAYLKNEWDTIVNIIRNFARGAGGILARKFFEMMAHDIFRKGGDFTVRRLSKDGIKQPEEELHLQNLAHKQFLDIDEIALGYYNK